MAIKFSIPNILSLTSTQPHDGNLLFVPDIKHLVAFVEGNLSEVEQGITGFADIMTKSAISKNLNQCANDEVFNTYKNIAGITLPLENTNYLQNGKFKVPIEDITLSTSANYSGMKALEKSIIESLFESQKPYMAIYKGISQSMIKIEDIVACVLAIGGRSLKPVNNPKALGYVKNRSILVSGLANMELLSNLVPSDIYTKTKPSDLSLITVEESRDVKYSTGEFDPSVNYDYSYEYFNESRIILNDTTVDEDPQDGKPPVVVFGIYNSKGEVLDSVEVPTWLSESGKFFGQFDKQTDFKYKWMKGKTTKYSHTQPEGSKWKRETYQSDTDVNGFLIKKGEAVLYFDKTQTSDHELYNNYFSDEVLKELSNEDLISSDKVKSFDDVKQKILDSSSGSNMIEQLLSMMVNYNYMKLYDGVETPLDKYAFKAKKINYDGKSIWIDPESDYDLKVIKIDSTSAIKYWDVTSKSEIKSEVVFFDSRSIDIYVSDRMTLGSIDNINPTAPRTATTTFSAIVKNNGIAWNSYKDVNMISIPNPLDSDNFTIEVSKIGKSESKHTFVLDDKPGPSERLGIHISNAGKGLNIGQYSMTTQRVTNISNQVMVRDFGKSQSKLIDIALINNDYLKKSTKYSSGEYGQDSQCTIESLIRFMEYGGDVETYYMVEGILSSTNDGLSVDIVGGGKSGRGYYKLKDVVKAVRKFISLLIHLSVKIFPPITKALEIISNPTKLPNFVVDIIRAKIGDDFGAGGVKFETFSSKFINGISIAMSNIDNIKQDINLDFESKRSQIVDHINKTKLKNYFYVNNDLEVKCLLDGESIYELFNITIGIKVSDMIPKLKLYKNKKIGSDAILASGSNLSPEDIEVLKVDSALYKNLSSVTSVSTLSDISVVYSTGDYIEGVDYEYTYVSEKVSEIIQIGEALVESGDLIGALKVYSQYILLDPGNQTIQDKYKNTFDRAGKDYLYEMGLNNPLFDLMLGMISAPIKMVKEIIDYLAKFFKSLSNPFTLPKKISEFVSFQWVLELFSKEGIMKALGMKINIPGLKKLINSSGDVDLSGMIIIPFMAALPKFNADQFNDVNLNSLTGGVRSIFLVIENIFNMFIDLIWAIMGLAPLLKKRPYLNMSGEITPDITGDISDYIINMILGQEDNQFIRGDVSSTTILRSFVYDIKLPDGRMIKDLDRAELDKWISDNENLNIELNF